ncbi:MAG: four helix bundle protein [Candidatus Aureabacteria bacterium]|nr:four helix bundle protein [Candidatus Auribacterota bacterium]
MKTFRDLKAWERAHGLVLEIYKVTKDFPPDERFGLSAQIRRSAASIPTNIVEGFKRRSDREFAHFLNIADASLEETKYHIILASDLGYIDRGKSDKLTVICDEVGKMLNGLQKKLNP